MDRTHKKREISCEIIMTNGFSRWASGFSGCDGGDIGSPEQRATWVCGIEWGGGHDFNSLVESIEEDVSSPPVGYEVWEHNLDYIFNWQVMKLLCAIDGGKVEEYKTFAEKVMPFVSGQKGYFKMNLYPIAFKNTSGEKWVNRFSEITGFESKDEYVKWCKCNRLQKIRSWAKQYKPNTVICLGKSYISDFVSSFLDESSEIFSEIIDEKEIKWAVNLDGTYVFVLPFMVNRNGLVKNVSIQKVGARIAEIKNQKNDS